MKTSDLVAALAADNAAVEPPLGRHLAVAAACGVALAVVAFATVVGPRADWRAALESGRFVFKFGPTILLAVAACGALLRLGRPDGRMGGWGWALLATVALQIGAVGFELMAVPSSEWAALAMGKNHWHCLALTPFLSIAPLAAALVALRHGATTRPGLTGAVAGLAAAGVGATLYAANCTDDSPLFVGIWYPLAVAIVAAVGAAIGRHRLAW